MKQNIIFYFSDQQRWDTINEQATPNLIELAKDGIKFEKSFTCQPVCGPARACLQTGVFASKCGCHWNGVSLPLNIKPIAEYFNEDGYDTAYFGKWHLASNNFSEREIHCETTAIPKELQGGYKYWRAADVLEFTSHGYDGYVFDENENRIEFKGYRADCINNFALEYLDNYDNTKPFFIFISQIEPHHQNDHDCFEGPTEKVKQFSNYKIPDDLSFLKGNYKESYPDYIAAVNSLDENVGKLVLKLKEKGLYENTTIIYTSDHGCHFKTRNSEYKRSCHESSIHTPLIISGGKFAGGKKDRRLVSLIDLPPTLLSIADIPIPKSYMGTDLALGTNNNLDYHDCVFIQISESQVGRAIRTNRYKYSVSAGGEEIGWTKYNSAVYYEEFLYDLEKDPLEKSNLVSDSNYNLIRASLKQLLIKQMKNAGEAVPEILPACSKPN